MEEQPYHHGNLRNELIEAGIRLINENGYSSFSIRGVATACGVSHSAPYRHFKSKEELLDAMRLYVEDQFVSLLEKSAADYEYNEHYMISFGSSYVDFFAKNPQYFYFFTRQKEPILAISDTAGIESESRPFILFKQLATRHLLAQHIPPEAMSQIYIAMWGMVHGLASMATMPSVQYSGDWKTLTENVLRRMK